MNKQDLIKQGDKLVTPVTKLLHPYCEGCGAETSTGHHFIEKSRSNYLRFKPINFIGLCISCHAKIHNQFGNNIVGGVDLVKKIEKDRGKKWAKEIRSLEHKSIKADVIFWQQEVENLKQYA
jgi:5-methylcytosine-specific restriction endonuclease McrA